MRPIPHLRRATCIALFAWLSLALSTSGVRAQSPESARPERPALRLEAIEVMGADSSVADAVSHLLNLDPGDEIDTDRLVEARRRLVESGWFETVTVSTARGNEPGQIVLRVEGELDRSARFETGIGHQPLEGWYLNLAGVRWNHALGPGSLFRGGWQFGERRSQFYVDAEIARLFGTGADFLVRFRAGGDDLDFYEGDAAFRQRIDRAELALGLRWELNRNLRSTVWLGTSGANPASIRRIEGEDSLSVSLPDLGLDQERETTFDLGLQLVSDHRDRHHPWIEGGWFGLGMKRSQRESGDAYHRADLQARWSFPVGDATSLSLRATGAWSDPDTPYHRRPTLGGGATVRGFREASLSGVEGARQTASVSAEWRTPLLGRGSRDARVYGVLFADAGTLVDAAGDGSQTSVGVGWGLRIRVPWIQFLVLDAAIPLTSDATNDPIWIHGGLGFGF